MSSKTLRLLWAAGVSATWCYPPENFCDMWMDFSRFSSERSIVYTLTAFRLSDPFPRGVPKHSISAYSKTHANVDARLPVQQGVTPEHFTFSLADATLMSYERGTNRRVV